MRLAGRRCVDVGLLLFVFSGWRRDEFATQAERLLRGVGANQAAIVLARTRAEEALKEADRRKAEQARETAILEERNRMAGEIHDGLGQAFTGILLQLGALELLLANRSGQERALVESAREL